MPTKPAALSLPIPAAHPAITVAPAVGLVLGASVSPTDAVTQDELTTALDELGNSLRQIVYSTVSAPNSFPATGGYTNDIALTNRIDQLSGTKLSNITVSSVAGLTASDIPSLLGAYFPATSTIAIGFGGTGTSTAPTANKVLLADGSGNWEYAATSSLGIGGGGASALSSLSDVLLSGPSFGNVLEFNGSKWANLATSTLGIALSDTTGTLAVSRGGTGTSTSPAANQLLLSDSSGKWEYVATSSLGISGGGSGSVGSGTQGQFAFYNAGGTALTATSSLFLAQNGNVGISTTSPFATLSITGQAGKNALAISTSSDAVTAFRVSQNGNLHLANGGGIDIGNGVTPPGNGLIVSGNVGIGSTSPAAAFSLSGNAYITGGLGLGVVSTNAGTLNGWKPSFAVRSDNATLVSGGIGYAVGDTITLAGGVCTNQPVISVLNVSAGVITAFSVNSSGDCTSVPPNPAAQLSTTGGGSGATFTLSYGTLAGSLVFNPYNNSGGVHQAGANNMALGGSAGGSFSGVYLNLAIGPDALNTNSTGDENLAVGPLALHSFTGGSPGTCGSGNVALGINSQGSNVSGCNNVSIGTDSLTNMTSASQNNVMVGNSAAGQNDIGGNNVGVGYGVLNNGTNARISNIAIGYETLIGQSTSAETRVTALGSAAISGLSLGSPTRDAALGDGTGAGSAFNGADDVLIGSSAGHALTGNANSLTIIGSLAGLAATTPTHSIIIGDNVAESTFSTASHVLMICTIGTACDGNTSNLLNLENILIVTGTNVASTSRASLAGALGVGTSTPFASGLSVQNVYGNPNGAIFAVASSTVSGGSTANTLLLVNNNGNVGIGTTNPGTKLEVNGTASTSNLVISDITNGSTQCLQVDQFGNIVGTGAVCGGSGSAPGGSEGQIQFNHFSSFTGASNLIYSNSTGYVGVSSSTPSASLDVGGFINVGTTFGYQQGDQTILTASSTSGLTLGGLGAGPGLLATTTANTGNTIFGYQALNIATSSRFETAFGYQALNAADDYTNNGNTAMGYKTLANDTTGAGNAAVGELALLSNNSGGNNAAFGANALQNDTGSSNTGLGFKALFNNSSGANNVAIGLDADFYNQTGSNNVAVGESADGFGNGATALHFNNTAIGYQAGYDISTGAKDIFLGWNSASTSATGSNNIAIGYDIALPSVNGSNQLDIGNLIFGTGINAEGPSVSTGNIAVGTSSPYARLSVWGPDTASSTPAFNIVSSASTTLFAVFDGGNAQLSGTLTQSSDQRLKTNIQSLDASSTLALIAELNPVTFNWIDPNQGLGPQVGFIAQQVQQVFPQLVSTTSATALTPGGTLGLNYIGLISPIIAAIQALDHEITALATTVAGFAQNFATQTLVADNGTFRKVSTQQLCVTDNANDPAPVCVTKGQLAALLSQSAQAGTSGSVSSSPSNSGDPSSQNSSSISSKSVSSSRPAGAPPTIVIAGDNPAIIHVGDSYQDLGATIVAPDADKNLGLKYFLNGALVSDIVIDTSQVATDTIDYVATDTAGLTATSTRTVIIELASAPSISPDYTSPTTMPAASSTPATVASSTAQ